MCARLMALCLALSACGGAETELASGDPCLRTVQCAPGLVCALGMCTNDLSLLDAGGVPNLDASADVAMDVAMDAPPSDALEDAPPPLDTGMDAIEDTSMPPEDTSMPPEDTSMTPEDTSMPPEDTSMPPEDTSMPPEDTGTDASDDAAEDA